jgi:DNA-binding XRE family transcriptional regulator
MGAERIHRKIDRTPADRARLAAARDRYRREHPGLDALVGSGEFAGPVALGEYLDLARAVRELRRQRERIGLSLADVSERSGLGRAAISRLENGHNANPTLDTIRRYAAAVGKDLVLTFPDRVDPPAGDGRS